MLDLDIDEMVVYSKDGGAPGWRDGPAEKKKKLKERKRKKKILN